MIIRKRRNWIKQADEDGCSEWMMAGFKVFFVLISPTFAQPSTVRNNGRRSTGVCPVATPSLPSSLPSALKPNNNLFSLQATASPLPAQSTSYFVILFQPATPYHRRCTTSNTENIRSAVLSWNEGFHCTIKSPAVSVTWCLCC
jgi:hypothetical protein